MLAEVCFGAAVRNRTVSSTSSGSRTHQLYVSGKKVTWHTVRESNSSLLLEGQRTSPKVQRCMFGGLPGNRTPVSTFGASHPATERETHIHSSITIPTSIIPVAGYAAVARRFYQGSDWRMDPVHKSLDQYAIPYTSYGCPLIALRNPPPSCKITRLRSPGVPFSRVQILLKISKQMFSLILNHSPFWISAFSATS